MNELVQQAYDDYCHGMKYKEIAEKYGVSLSAVKSWASRYWKNGCDQKEKKLQPEKKKVVTQKTGKKKVVAEEIMDVMENPELTDKQRLFCVLYVKCFNATKAYQKAYAADYVTAVVNGPRLLGNARVKEQIMQLKQERLNREMLNEYDIFQKYMDIAFADITDFVEFGREEVQVMGAFGPVQVENPDTGEKVPLLKEVNTIRFRESMDIDGTLITEVKQGKDGASIKLADRMKALDWLASHMDLATEEQKARIAVLKSQVEKDEEQPIQITFKKAGGKDRN